MQRLKIYNNNKQSCDFFATYANPLVERVEICYE